MTTTTIDYATIKSAQQAGWQAGDYPKVGNTLQIMAETLVEAVDAHAGQAVLDVACGQGNAAIAAARRFAVATGLDYAPRLLDQARTRAAAEGVDVTFTEGDAESMPFADASFDVVVSTVGVMFTPDHRAAAGEIARVARPGGRLGLACWTPTGMVGEMFKLVGSFAPPPPGLVPPAAWGTAEHLEELFGSQVEWTSLDAKEFVFRYRSPEHFAEWFCEHYGPMTRMLAPRNPEECARFASELADLARRFNHATDGTLAASAEYLEAIGVRR